MADVTLTAERLRSLLCYCPDTGAFTRVAPVKGRHAGQSAGTLEAHGYVVIVIDRRRHYAHRLAFLFMTGAFPAGHVDHINGARADNRWVNLRQGSRTLNQQNMRRARSDSQSGLIGAHKKGNRWQSKIRVNGGYVRLGSFTTPEAASSAYLDAKRRLHEGCTL